MTIPDSQSLIIKPFLCQLKVLGRIHEVMINLDKDARADLDPIFLLLAVLVEILDLEGHTATANLIGLFKQRDCVFESPGGLRWLQERVEIVGRRGSSCSST